MHGATIKIASISNSDAFLNKLK